MFRAESLMPFVHSPQNTSSTQESITTKNIVYSLKQKKIKPKAIIPLLYY